MWLPWQWSMVLALGFAVVTRMLLSSGDEPKRRIASFTREAAIIAVLYSAWIYVGRFTLLKIDGAVERGEWIWDFQRSLFWPNEEAIQSFFMQMPWTIQASNLFYGGVHVPAMGVFLVWFFAKHREDYRSWRNTLALLTLSCVAIQLLPVAPPRLVPYTEMIDTGYHFSQSVFEPLGSSKIGQLQAMPSIHIAWAGLIAAAMWKHAGGWLKWLGVAHLCATFFVVVVTANHYWLDGVVALVLLAGFRVLDRVVVARFKVDDADSDQGVEHGIPTNAGG